MSKPAERIAFLTERPFAHRGLHGHALSENGTAAFQAAIAGGFGVECDVRVSADGVAMIYHDALLKRLTGREGYIKTQTAAALDAIALSDGGRIPRLATLLDLCGTDVPLLIEIKVDGIDIAGICAAIARDLDARHDAKAAVMSFNPLAIRWFARRRPQFARGLVVTQQGKSRVRGGIEHALALWLAKPDFLACDIRDLPSRLSLHARRRATPVLTWTVRGGADRARAVAHADQIIFEQCDA